MGLFDAFKKPEDTLWDIVNKLWEEESENPSQKYKEYFDYWDGKLKQTFAATHYFPEQKKTPVNQCKKIVETKLDVMLDTPFEISVKPKLNAFADVQTIKSQNAYADILNEEIHNILESNKIDSYEEQIGRRGLIGGFAPGQVVWETNERAEGEIKISPIDPASIRWNKNAKSFSDLTFIAYEIEVNPAIAKRKYAKNSDGTFNEELCKKIEQISDTKTNVLKGQMKGAISRTSNELSEVGYTYESGGITSGKTVKLVVMFLLDDSVYAPEEQDNTETIQNKKKWQVMYPNGRMLVFSPNKDKKIILEDRPVSKAFKNLGNIDFFNPIKEGCISGQSIVDNIVPIQDRINGALLKMRKLISEQLNVLGVDKTKQEFNDSDFISNPIVFFEKIIGGVAGYVTVINNGAIEEAMKLKVYIDSLKQESYELERINETMLAGIRQTGTTSAEQVEALQESPLSSIRKIQRNFKEFIVSQGEKIIALIQENYTVQRLIKLSTGQNGGQYAMFNQDESGQRFVELLNEAGQSIQQIKINPEWQFVIEVTSGTKIPRSRRESAGLMDVMLDKGMLGDPMDIDTKELYMRTQDIPNYRSIISLQRRKQEQSANMPPQAPQIEVIMQNKDLATAFSNILKGLDGYSPAKSQLLQSVGLNPAPDTLDTAPITATTSKGSITEAAAISPQTVSGNPEMAEIGAKTAAVIEGNKLKEGSVISKEKEK